MITKIHAAGKNCQVSKSKSHEVANIYFQAELQNFFCSCRDNDNSVGVCWAIFFVRLGFNRCAIKFFLLSFFGGKIGSGGKKKFGTGEKNHADWSFAEARNDFCSFGSGGAHIDGAFFINGGMFHSILYNFARGSDLSWKGDFIGKIFL